MMDAITYRKLTRKAKSYMDRATDSDVFFWFAYAIGLRHHFRGMSVSDEYEHRQLLAITPEQPHDELRASGLGYRAGYDALHPDMLFFVKSIWS